MSTTPSNPVRECQPNIVEPKIGDALNVLLLIEHGLDEPLATRTAKQWGDKCKEVAALLSRAEQDAKRIEELEGALLAIDTHLDNFGYPPHMKARKLARAALQRGGA